MEFTDKTLICFDCDEEFVFSAGEQIFFKEMQFAHEPKRCKKCKGKRFNIRPRLETAVICAECGTSTIVPFVPREDRPVCAVCAWIGNASRNAIRRRMFLLLRFSQGR